MTDSPATRPGAAHSEADWPSPVRAWCVASALSLAYVFSFLDRQIINLLAPAIKRDLQLSDIQLSLIQGLAFAIPFVLFGLLFGALADRWVRKRIVSFGMIVWSLMTSLCGTTQRFGTLFGFRAGVGIGEAVLNPSAVSLISDYFPPVRRPAALALYNLGTTLGAALGYMLIAQLIPSGPVTLPLLGTVAPWQATFAVLGIPGLAFALLLLLMREPARRGLMLVADGGAPVGYRDALGFMWSRRAVFIPLFAGMAMLGLVVYGPASQTTLFFTRTFGWSIRDIGRVNGVLILVSAVPGSLFGGYLASRLRRTNPDGTLRAILYATLGLIVPATVPWVFPQPWMVWIGLGLQNFAVAGSMNLASAAIADVTPNQLRGKIVALYAIVLTLIGLGLGPSFIALITQYVLHDEQQIRYSLLIFSAVVTPLAALAMWLALPAFRRVVEESAGWTGRQQ